MAYVKSEHFNQNELILSINNKLGKLELAIFSWLLAVPIKDSKDVSLFWMRG